MEINMLSVEIRIKGQLDEQWSQWFEGFELAHEDETGETIMTGQVPDQAALYGLVAKLRDLGIQLVSFSFNSEASSEGS
jgi:hypothetical protein